MLNFAIANSNKIARTLFRFCLNKTFYHEQDYMQEEQIRIGCKACIQMQEMPCGSNQARKGLQARKNQLVAYCLPAALNKALLGLQTPTSTNFTTYNP